MEKAGDIVMGLIVPAIIAIVSGVWWLVRRIFTNQQQIDHIIHDLKSRDELRRLDREEVSEIKQDVKYLVQLSLENRR